MTNEDLAYIAGVIDGEGSIQIYKRKTSLKKGEKTPLFTLFVKIYNTDIRMLEFIRDKINKGNVILHNPKKKIKRRNCYRWCVIGSDAQDLLEKVYQFLVIKKEQADVVFKFRKTYNQAYTRNGTPKEVLEIRNECYDKLKQLHHKEF